MRSSNSDQQMLHILLLVAALVTKCTYGMAHLGNSQDVGLQRSESINDDVVEEVAESHRHSEFEEPMALHDDGFMPLDPLDGFMAESSDRHEVTFENDPFFPRESKIDQTFYPFDKDTETAASSAHGELSSRQFANYGPPSGFFDDAFETEIVNSPVNKKGEESRRKAMVEDPDEKQDPSKKKCEIVQKNGMSCEVCNDGYGGFSEHCSHSLHSGKDKKFANSRRRVHDPDNLQNNQGHQQQNKVPQHSNPAPQHVPRDQHQHHQHQNNQNHQQQPHHHQQNHRQHNQGHAHPRQQNAQVHHGDSSTANVPTYKNVQPVQKQQENVNEKPQESKKSESELAKFAKTLKHPSHHIAQQAAHLAQQQQIRQQAIQQPVHHPQHVIQQNQPQKNNEQKTNQQQQPNHNQQHNHQQQPNHNQHNQQQQHNNQPQHNHNQQHNHQQQHNNQPQHNHNQHNHQHQPQVPNKAVPYGRNPFYDPYPEHRTYERDHHHGAGTGQDGKVFRTLDPEENFRVLGKMVKQFSKKDRKTCEKKVKKNGMTCYTCPNKKGQKNEECMYENNDPTKGVHLMYEEESSY